MNRPLFPPALRAIAFAVVLILGTARGAAAIGPEQAQVVASCRVQAANVVLRSGPGAAFPAIGNLLQGTVVRGLAFVRTGVPGGSWVEVEVTPGTPAAFLPADAQSLRCQPAASTLPQRGRQRISRVPVDGGDLSDEPVVRGPANVNNGQYIILPGLDANYIRDVLDANGGTMRFSDGFGFGVEPLDVRTGRTIGSGIREVQFVITYFDFEQNDDVIAYQTTEVNAPYCVFSDENGQCNVFRFSKMGNKWPDTRFGKGAPRPADETPYVAEITIVPNSGDPILWRWQFSLAALAVEFP